MVGYYYTDRTVNQWFQRMQIPGEWGDAVVSWAFARMMSLDLVIYVLVEGRDEPWVERYYYDSGPDQEVTAVPERDRAAVKAVYDKKRSHYLALLPKN